MTWYIDECNRQLNDTKFYQQLNEDMTASIQKRVTFYVYKMHTDNYINDKTKQYLIQTDVKPGRFYILPKPTLSKKPYFILTFGYDISMIFLRSGLEVQIT